MEWEKLLHCLVDFFFKEKIIIGFVKEVKGKRLLLFLPTGREELINVNALLSAGKKKFSFSDSFTLQNFLKEKQELREKLKENFNLKELWEVLTGEVERGSAWDFVELYLGRVPNCDEVSAFMRKVYEEGIYFVKEGINEVRLRKEDEVKALWQQRQKELEWLKLLQEGESVLSALISGKREEIPLEQKEKWLKLFKTFLLKEENFEKGKIVSEVLKRNGISEPLKIVELFIQNKYTEEDWFWELEKSNFPLQFSSKELEEVEKILQSQIDLNQLEDLTYLNSFTIDAEETEDFDDALSVEEKDGNYILYIHIADVARFIKPHSYLWEGALERASTLYLPETILPMFPFKLSHQKFSLKKEEPKPSLTFKFTLTQEGKILDFAILPALILIKNRYTYEEVDEFLNKLDPFFTQLYNLLMAFKEKRKEQGALGVFLPDVLVKVLPKGEFLLQRITLTPARDLISEAMILTNFYSAKWASEKGIPLIYRLQKEPFQIFEERHSSLYYQILQLKFMAKSELSLEPGFHSGLGLPYYTTLTSPIRRALDLISQYQIESYLLGKEPLKKEELSKILPTLQVNLQRAQFLQARRKRYFLLKYLQKYEKNNFLQGLVLEVQNKKAKVYLPAYNLTGELIDLKGELSPGMEIALRIEKINPLYEVLRLKKV